MDGFPGRVQRCFHGNMEAPRFEGLQQPDQAVRVLQEGFAAAQGDPAVARAVILLVPQQFFHDIIQRAMAVRGGVVLKRLHLRILAPGAPHVAALEKEGGANPGAVMHAGALYLEGFQRLKGLHREVLLSLVPGEQEPTCRHAPAMFYGTSPVMSLYHNVTGNYESLFRLRVIKP
ncbi:MAG: hypothetical protein BWY09_02752 [Candidatus Hydrogenedentes bacterium ADurb.Bin179]|nr:MAG: hypothetical protein BWY09_02752 [Candidatus Hydrogenedentes bacterium ADurb.Bin179]